jgi:hypothetical protein
MPGRNFKCARPPFFQLLTPLDANPVSLDDLRSRIYLPLALVLLPLATNSVVYKGVPRLFLALASVVSLAFLWSFGAVAFVLDQLVRSRNRPSANSPRSDTYARTTPAPTLLSNIRFLCSHLFLSTFLSRRAL